MEAGQDLSDADARPEASAKTVLVLLLLVILLGAGLRLYDLSARSLWYDECASLYLTRFVDAHLSILNPSDNTEAPMNAVLTKVWYGLVRTVTHFPVTSPWNDFFIRLLPCLLGIAAIPLVFVVGRRVLSDPWAGLIAAFLFAISPFQIYYAQELRIYAFVVVMGLLALYCMLRALEEDRLKFWAGMVASLAVLLYSHYFSVWIIFSFNVYFLFTIGAHRRLFWKWVAANLVLMALIAPGLYLAWEMNLVVLSIEYPWYPSPTWKTGFITFTDFFAGYGPSVWAFRMLFVLAGLLSVAGIAALYRRWKMAVLLVALVFVPIAGNVYIWSHRYFSFYEHRLFVFSGVMAVFAVANGLRALGRPWLTSGTLAAFALCTAPCLGDYYAHRLHPIEMHRLAIWDKVDFRSVADYIHRNLREGDLVGLSSHFLVYPMEHYLDARQCRLGSSVEDELVFLRGQGNEPLLRNHGLMPVPMKEATKGVQRVWFVESFGTTFEYKPQTDAMRGWFDEKWRRVNRKRFDGLVVTLYERTPQTDS
jgi:hypothetical protein